VALIEIRGLTKLYRMGDTVVRALDGVDLTIERGDFVAITGASGSGKSTMMHLLGCLDRPTGGTYILDGRDVGDLSDRELAAVRNRQIGFVFQTFNLINRTSAAENVGVPLFYARRTNTRVPALRALERVGLAARARHNPNELSGGERQRVAIARAIVNDPAVVLADEPTGNLDSHTGEQIIEIFRGLNQQGVTVVIVTHEPDIARQARRVVQMRDGKIVSDRLTAEVPAEPLAAPQPPLVGVGPAAPPAEQPLLAAAPVALTARLMRGANASLACSLTAAALLAAAIVAQQVLSRVYGVQQFNPDKPQIPPIPVIVGGLASCLAMAAALGLGIIGIVAGNGARKRMRTEPGVWLGRRRALAGLIVGCLAVAVSVGMPIVGIVVSIVKAM
jgi:putative ABC transport system ATP-binding protein